MGRTDADEPRFEIEGSLDFTVRLHLGWYPTLTYESLAEALTDCLQTHGWHRKGLMEIETESVPRSAQGDLFLLDPEALEKAEPDRELPPNHPG